MPFCFSDGDTDAHTAKKQQIPDKNQRFCLTSSNGGLWGKKDQWPQLMAELGLEHRCRQD